jgi:hypothetical protein
MDSSMQVLTPLHRRGAIEHGGAGDPHTFAGIGGYEALGTLRSVAAGFHPSGDLRELASAGQCG